MLSLTPPLCRPLIPDSIYLVTTREFDAQGFSVGGFELHLGGVGNLNLFVKCQMPLIQVVPDPQFPSFETSS